MRQLFFSVFLLFVASNSFSNISKKISSKDLNFPVTLDNSNLNVKLNTSPGEPTLPYIRYDFLLPAEANPLTVNVKLNETERKLISGEYFINAAEAEVEDGIILREEKEKREAQIYNVNQLFPKSNIYSIKIGALRQFNIVTVKLFPYQYNPVTKTLTKLENCVLDISYENEDAARKKSIQTSSKNLNRLKNSTVNYDECIKTYNANSSRSNDGYAIITTNAIESGLNKLQAFINNKKARGFDVSVVTEDQWGGGTGNSSADNLRSWLEDNYLSNNIYYLLIIGNPSPSNGDIAMKNAYAYYGGKIAHTDYYFSELTGDWDADGDGKYGETDDVKANGGIDAFSEISVGRIPCYNGNYSTVDDILQKCIDYEAAKDSEVLWRKNMLLAMDGYYGSEGPEVGEKIKDDVESSSSSWDFYRIYCNHLVGPEEGILTPQAVSNAWSSGKYGLVTWLTHGSETAAMNVFSTSYVPNLNDSYPSFVIMGSCLNGKPDNSVNLAYSVLKNGGIGVIAGSETTIFRQPMGDFVGSSYNHGIIHALTKNIALDGGYISDALNKARHEADMGCWKNYCCYNLYGDPAMGIDVYGVEGQTDLNGINFTKNNSPINIKLNGNILKIMQDEKGYNDLITLKLYNLQGRILFNRKINSEQNNIKISSLKLGNSILFCQLNFNGKTFVKQLSIIK